MTTRHNQAKREYGHSSHACLLTPEEVAARLSVAVQTLAHWRVRGTGPSYVHLSARCVRYPEPTLEQWVAERLQDSTAENSSK